MDPDARIDDPDINANDLTLTEPWDRSYKQEICAVSNDRTY